MARHLVCITFDFDAMSGMIARGLTTPTPISRGEFGAVAVPRILSLLRTYSVATTWFIPGFTLETYPAQCAAIMDDGHEIAHHGWTHVPPNDMSRDQEEAGMVRANEAIHRLSGNTLAAIVRRHGTCHPIPSSCCASTASSTTPA